MFKQKELDKLTKVKSPGLCETNAQQDILDIIGKEVPPDYVIEKPNVLKSPEKTGDIFDILKSEVPPDYVDDTTNNNSGIKNKLVISSDSKVTSKLQSKIVENDEASNTSILDSLKENPTKSFNLIANYGEEDLEDLGKN